MNPSTNVVMEPAIMSARLHSGLTSNKVNFKDDYRGWTKPDMLRKLSKVMGVTNPGDPDGSYVLTVDNIIKILAIQMRFR